MSTQQNKIVKVVELAAPIAKVWRAIADHEAFGAWFGVKLNDPFAVGKTTTGHITQPGHEHVQWLSVTEEMQDERLFVFSWPPSALDSETQYAAEAKVRVEFRLEAAGEGTRLTITESGFEQFPDAKRLEILRSNTEGWNIQARNIATYVSG